MTVIQLGNVWANWNAFTTVILQTDGGDEIGVFQHHEDVLNLFGDKKVYAFGSVDAKDTVIIAIEV
mgnify:FL=1